MFSRIGGDCDTPVCLSPRQVSVPDAEIDTTWIGNRPHTVWFGGL
jgi:hypothetical protein